MDLLPLTISRDLGALLEAPRQECGGEGVLDIFLNGPLEGTGAVDGIEAVRGQEFLVSRNLPTCIITQLMP